jgi:hypothetical protein
MTGRCGAGGSRSDNKSYGTNARCARGKDARLRMGRCNANKGWGRDPPRVSHASEDGRPRTSEWMWLGKKKCDGSGSYGFPTGPTIRRIPEPAQGSLEDTEQGGMISKYSRTDLIEQLGKLVYVTELGLSNCN